MMNPKISIIVPVFKVEPYIRKCVDSILAQTFTDFELILVDDGSPDSCGDICDQYAKQDPRVNVIHQENRGLSAARNVGITIAKGEYIGFVDSDDYINKNMYYTLYKYAQQNKSEVVVCDVLKVTENQASLDNMPNKVIDSKIFTNIEALHQLYEKDPGNYITNAGINMKWLVVWNKLYSKSIFNNIKFPDGRICEDEYIIHKVLYNCKNITYISSELYYYLQRSKSIIHSPFSIKRLDKVYALKERADFFKTIQQKDLHFKSLKSFMDAFFWNYYKAKFEVPGVKTELHNLKKTFNRSFYDLLKNPLIGWRQKLAMLAFIVHPFLYEIYAY